MIKILLSAVSVPRRMAIAFPISAFTSIRLPSGGRIHLSSSTERFRLEAAKFLNFDMIHSRAAPIPRLETYEFRDVCPQGVGTNFSNHLFYYLVPLNEDLRICPKRKAGSCN